MEKNIKIMFRYLSLLFNFTILCISSEAQEYKFTCPMKNGEVVLDGRKVATHAKPSRIITIVGPEVSVSSISSGKVEAVDSAQNGLLTIYISCNNYTIIYENIRFFSLKIGDLVIKNEKIGEIDLGGSLKLMIIKDGITLDPPKLIECKVVYRRLE